ncbi:MAG: ABC transporter permease [Planctomycetaceae bacterium]|nr:ABC transporter permease [Planctomycetaceae bacterium]
MFAGPIFAREARVAPRSIKHFLIRIGYIGALFLLLYTASQTTFGWQEVSNIGEISRFGTLVFQLVSTVQLCLVMFFALLFCASNVSQEKDGRTLLLLLMTDMKSRELVLGKLFSSLLIVAVLIGASAPVFFLIQQMGGVTTDQILWVLLLCLAAAFTAGSWSTLIAYWRDKTFQTLAISVMGAGLFIAILEIVTALLGENSTAGQYVALFDPFRALFQILDPFTVSAQGQLVALKPVLALTGLGIVLNLITSYKLRKWNPSRFVYLAAKEKSDEIIPGRTKHRAVWDNPILWREICTRAYGRKIALIKVVYIAIAVYVGYIFYDSAFHPEQQSLIMGLISFPGLMFVGLALLSLILINAQAVTALTNERDGLTLELLLVTDVSPREFIFGKLGGILFNTKELVVLPVVLLGYVYYLRGLEFEQVLFTSLGFLVLVLFAAMLGLHSGFSYDRTRQSIAASLGTMFFLFIGIFIFMILLVEARGSFILQIPSFLVFILAGGIGLGTTLTNKNPSIALTMAAGVLPFLTFYAITEFLLAGTLGVCLAIVGAYGFATVAMMIPAISEFDVALGRSAHDKS